MVLIKENIYYYHRIGFLEIRLSIFARITQSKSKTIITRSMLTISLIVFTDKLQGHVHTFYSK